MLVSPFAEKGLDVALVMDAMVLVSRISGYSITILQIS